MPSKSIHLETDGMAPEIELPLRALTSELRARGIEVVVDGELPRGDESVIICSEGNAASFPQGWRVSPNIARGRVQFARGEGVVEIPWTAPRIALRRLPPTILARGSADSRPARMMARIAEELHRRRAGFRIALWGSSSAAAEERACDELHADPSAVDLSRLLCSSSAILELTTGETSPLPWMAEAVGVATVITAEHPFPGGIRVAEWSAESFADALERAVALDGSPGAQTVESSARLLVEALGIGG
jgi:hypothetical protein